jgi:4-hydroxy-tetrahydrodipicolinate synthase
MFSGSIVALITPFHNGEVDYESLKRLINWHIDSGTQGIVACGSTGEGILLPPPEWRHVLSATIQTSQKRIPVIAGCSTPSTVEAISLIQQAQELGADAALVVTPPYLKPSQEGIYRHFLAIHEASSLPLIIYNNPGRSVVDISVDLIIRLSELPRVVALKDSNTDLTRLIALRQKIQKPFAFLSGDDPTAAGYLAFGGHGFISVTANVTPHLMQDLVVSWQNGNLDRFKELRDQLMPLHNALGAETNPVPVKYAVHHLGFCQNELRMPLTPASSQTEQQIKTILQQIDLKQAA